MKTNVDYIPIASIPKKRFPIQIQLQNQYSYPYGVHILSRPSYLKVDTPHEVPIQMLEQAFDSLGCPLVMRTKHHGGLAELRAYIARRDRLRNEEEICRLMEKQTLEEDEV